MTEYRYDYDCNHQVYVPLDVDRDDLPTVAVLDLREDAEGNHYCELVAGPYARVVATKANLLPTPALATQETFDVFQQGVGGEVHPLRVGVKVRGKHICPEFALWLLRETLAWQGPQPQEPLIPVVPLGGKCPHVVVLDRWGIARAYWTEHDASLVWRQLLRPVA